MHVRFIALEDVKNPESRETIIFTFGVYDLPLLEMLSAETGMDNIKVQLVMNPDEGECIRIARQLARDLEGV